MVDREQIRRDAEQSLAKTPGSPGDLAWNTARFLARHCLALLAELEQAEEKVESERKARHAVESLNAEEIVRVRENWEALVASEKARGDEAEKERDWEREVVTVDLREKLEQAERERDEARKSTLAFEKWAEEETVARDAAEAQLAKVPALVEKAKQAKSQAAAPDYDEQAISETLWALVDAVLAAFEQEQKP